MIFLNLLHNITLLVSLGILYGIIIRRWHPGSAPYRIYSGLLFGSVSLVGMLTPLRLSPGVIFDGRSIILSLAGLFGGGTAALIATLMSATYRIWLGGDGALMGVSVITESALLGVLFGRLRRRFPALMHPLYILLFGALVHAIMLACTGLLPGGVKGEILNRIALPVMTIYPLAVLMLSLLFLDMEAHVKAENELTRSEEEYRLLVENANSIILRWTPDGVIRFMNGFGLRFFGYSHEELIGRNVVGTIIPYTDSAGRDLHQMVRDILQYPERFESNENENVCKDGRRVWIHWTNRAIRNEDGSLRELYTIGDDITDRRRAQSEVEESEKLFRRLVEGAPDGIFVQTDGHFAYLNRVALDLFGAESDSQLIGTPVLERFHPDFHDSIRQKMRELSEDNREQPIAEEMFLRLDGKAVIGEFSGVPIHYRGRDGGLVFFRDIAERKLSEQALKESEKLYRSLFENMLNGFAYCRMLFDDKGAPEDFIYLAVNQTFEQQTGLRDVIGKRVSEVIPGIRESDPQLLERYGQVATTGKPERFEIYVSSLEMWFWVSVYSPASGYFVAVFDVVTERKKAEEKLRRQAEFISHLINSMPYPVYYKDADGKYLGCNQAFREYLGVGDREVIGKTVFEVAPPGLAEIYHKADQELFANPGIQVYESVARTAGGSDRPVIFHKATFNNPDGSTGGIIGAIIDISELKNTEQALRESERKYRHLFEYMVTGFALHEMILDESGRPVDYRFLEVNPAFEKLTGLRAEYVQGRTLREVLPEMDQSWIERICGVALSGESLSFEEFYPGLGKHLELMVYSPQKGRFAVIFGDITARKKAEAELIRSEQKIRDILRVQPVGVGLAVDRRFVEVNNQVCDMLGYSREELIGQRTEMIYASPEVNEAVRKLYKQVAEQGTATIEVPCVRKDGRHIDIILNLSPLDHTDTSKGVVFTVLDITERKRMETELIKSEEKVRNILRVQPVGVGLLVDRVIKETNDQFCEMLGYAREELLEQSTRKCYLSQEDYDAVGKTYESKEERGSHQIETRFLRKDGRVIDVLISLAPMNPQDLSAGYAFAVIDITESKRMETELLRSQEKMKSILRVQPVGVGMVVDRVFKEVNKHYCEIVGYTREELLGRNTSFLYNTPEDYEAVGRFHGYVREHGSGTMETRHRRKDGRMIDLLLSFAPVDRNDYSKGHIFAALDITERKRAEQRLRFLASTVEQATESVIIRDTEGLIQYVNPAFEASSGYSADEVIGRNMHFMEFTVESQTLLKEIIGTTREGKVWSGRVQSLCKNGDILTEDITVTPIRDEKGEIVSYVTLKKDVTRELDLEDQLRVSQKLEAVGLLAGGVAHDLNNLLTPILGYSEMLLLEEKLSQAAQRDIQEIVNAGGRARDLVGQLMAFGRKQTLQVKALDMNEVISNMGKLLRRTLRENIRIEMQLSASVRAVRADRSQVEQVLMNLAVNAQDAMPEGGKLAIETRDDELDADYANHHTGVTPGRYVMLSVSDTGMGMPPEIKARIFDPFFTTKPIGQGTGLGLATVYGIVKQHGGHVWVYSEPGHGSTFKVYLPAIELEPAESEGAAVQAEAPGGNETLLVAEDDPNVRDLACTMLSGLGYKVLSGKTVSECLELAANYPDRIDILLTDVIMPNMSGRELYSRLQQARPGLRVLYMSGYAANLIADRGVLGEDICFIQKPFTRMNLARKVRECLNG